jgi:hypothetical protein
VLNEKNALKDKKTRKNLSPKNGETVFFTQPNIWHSTDFPKN